jgi:hypothetical protein
VRQIQLRFFCPAFKARPEWMRGAGGCCCTGRSFPLPVALTFRIRRSKAGLNVVVQGRVDL